MAIHLIKRKEKGYIYYKLVESLRVPEKKHPLSIPIYHIPRGLTKIDGKIKKKIISKIKNKDSIKKIDWNNINSRIKDNIRKKRISPSLDKIEKIIKKEVNLPFGQLLDLIKLEKPNFKKSNLMRILSTLKKQNRIFTFRDYPSSKARKYDKIPRHILYYTTNEQYAKIIDKKITKDNLDKWENINWDYVKIMEFVRKKNSKVKNPGLKR